MVTVPALVNGQEPLRQEPQSNTAASNNGVPILSTSVIRTEFGSTYLVGELRNDLPDVIESVRVLARYYDSDGRLIDTGSASTELSQLRPGENSPFKLSVTDDSSVAQRIANYNLTVDWDVASNGAKPAALRIHVGEERISGTDESYEVVGEVINEGSDDTSSVRVIATLYDETGKVIGTDSTYTEPSDVSAGQSAIFKITGTAGNRSGDVKSVNLTAQSNDYLMIYPELEQKMQQIQLQRERNVTTFQSIADGFRIKVPSGWFVQDVNNTDIDFQRIEEQRGMAPLTIVCSQAAAKQVIDGSYECNTSSNDYLLIVRFKQLDNRQEFASIQNRSITISDFLTFYPKFLENRAALEGAPISNIQVVNETDKTINVTSTQTNQTVATVPAKLVEFTFTAAGLFRVGEISLLVLDGTTGYSMIYLIPPFSSMQSEQPPKPVQQIFDSFELLQPTNGSSTSSSLNLMASSSSTPQGQQQNQSGGTAVSIVSGSSGLTTDAYQPNPVQVDVNGRVTWTNGDAQPHTVTSGENATPDGRFDSGILAPRGDFEHTFTEAGQYPYFCLLHPNMVGTVVVTDGSSSSREATSNAGNTTTASTIGSDNAANPLAGLAQSLEDLTGGEDQKTAGSNSTIAATPAADVPITVKTDKSSYSTGETITITGTIKEDRTPNASIVVRVVDPNSNTLLQTSVPVTASNTFTHTLIANYRTSGDYHVQASYMKGRGLDIAETTFKFVAQTPNG